MEFVRLFSAADPRFSAAMELYQESFPLHEQRKSASQAAIMALEDYHFDLFYDDGSFAGALLYWETADLIYVEHFCVNPFPHVHPPYRDGYQGHKLVVMSYPRPLSQAEYDRFARYLRETVMGH